jgi:hypothetical protein
MREIIKDITQINPSENVLEQDMVYYNKSYDMSFIVVGNFFYYVNGYSTSPLEDSPVEIKLTEEPVKLTLYVLGNKSNTLHEFGNVKLANNHVVLTLHKSLQEVSAE